MKDKSNMNCDIDKQRSNVHILLVDDEEILTKLWEQIILREGYQVTSFTNGLQALEHFKSEPDRYDLIITDQSMPGISGSELATEVIKIREDIKIIMCSGNLDDLDMENEVNKKISEFLAKPFYIKTFLEAIERNL